MTTFTLYHNPRCSKSREALALLEARGVDVTVHRYLDAPLDIDALRDLAQRLEDGVPALVRTNEAQWKSLALETPSDGVPGEVVAADRQGIDIATGDGILRVGELQLPGKRRMAARDAVNGRDWIGHRFGT